MEKKITELAQHLINSYQLTNQIENNKQYWINKAKEEAGFIPEEGDGVHVEITLFKIRVSIHHKNHNGSKYWINGEWRDSPFGSDYPDLDTLI